MKEGLVFSTSRGYILACGLKSTSLASLKLSLGADLVVWICTGEAQVLPGSPQPECRLAFLATVWPKWLIL